MHGGFTRRGPDWRRWIVVLAVTLIGATSVSTIWHGPHDADQDCAVCSLRHHADADLVGVSPAGPVETPEPGHPGGHPPVDRRGPRLADPRPRTPRVASRHLVFSNSVSFVAVAVRTGVSAPEVVALVLRRVVRRSRVPWTDHFTVTWSAQRVRA